MIRNISSHLLKLQKDILNHESGEKGRRGSVNVSLFYPNSYNVGISTLALHRVFELTKRVPEIGVNRLFLEGKKEKEVLPLDNSFGIEDSQIIAFFLSYELDYLNVIKSLYLLNIPLRSSERGEKYPLIIGGGAAITINPQVFDEVFDIIFVGEAEESYVDFLKLFYNFRDKEEILNRASNIEGTYIPSRMKAYRRAFYKDFPLDFSKSIFFTKKGEFGDCHLIEVTRGCPARCNFCISRILYAPLRFADKEIIKEIIKNSVNKKIGLLGASVSYHPSIKELMEFIVKEKKNFSISSLRADMVDEEFINLLYLGGNRTITLAPEAGTERLRNYIEKGITEEDLERATMLALERGFSGLRLYFMIGLPTETMEDIEGIISFAKKIRQIEKSVGKRFVKRTFTLSPFVPKRLTPLSDYPMEDVKKLSEKINFLRKALTNIGIEVLYEHPKTAHLEYELSRKNILKQEKRIKG